MEQMGGFQDEKVLIGNQMQMALASMHGEDIGDFIERHAQDFRNTINANPKFLEMYKENPEQALSEISKEIYH